MKKFLFILTMVPTLLLAQTSKKDSLWLPFKPFIGKWQGTGGGEPGTGTYQRSYNFIFNNNFIEIRNKSIYPPGASNPQGEIHEDLGYFSYDKFRKTYVLRQFHIEGFVNVYYLDSISPDRKTIVFRTNQIENIPPGWEAKESYHIINNNEIEESFELAEPGKSFTPYSKVKLIRK